MAKPATNSVPDVTGDNEDYQAKQDAETLKTHAEIQADPARLKAATAHLAKQKQQIGSAHKSARDALMQKTGERMKKAFGQHGPQDETPFEKAGENS